jgi:hypothetical protein
MQLSPVFMNSNSLEVFDAIAMVGRFSNTQNFVMTVWRNQTRKEFADDFTPISKQSLRATIPTSNNVVQVVAENSITGTLNDRCQHGLISKIFPHDRH